MNNFIECRQDGGELLLSKTSSGVYSGPIYEEIKAQVIRELSDLPNKQSENIVFGEIKPAPVDLMSIGNYTIKGDGSVQTCECNPRVFWYESNEKIICGLCHKRVVESAKISDK